MPRIRSLKPEIWHSRDMTRLSTLGRLVFVILITQADDEGRLYADALHVAKAFLGNGRLASGVAAQLKLMRSFGMVVTYLDASSRPVIALCNFGEQQKIDHPKPSRIQKPPEIRESSRRSAKPRESSAQIRSDQTVSEGIFDPPTPLPMEDPVGRTGVKTPTDEDDCSIESRGWRGGAESTAEVLARLKLPVKVAS